MPATTVSIVCNVSLPTGLEFTSATYKFRLSETDYDTASNETITTTEITAAADGGGGATVSLWPVTRGTRNSFYRVILTAAVNVGGVNVWQDYTLGTIRPPATGAPHELADLLAQSSGGILVGSITYATLADAVQAATDAAAAGADPIAAIAARDAAIAARDAAAASAVAAALYDGPKVDTFSQLASVTPAMLAVNGLIRVIETGAVYRRVSSGGHLNYSGSGGVRLNALPGSDGYFTPEHFGAVGDAVDSLENGRFRNDWTTATAYAVGDLVQEPTTRRGVICRVAHTSGTYATDKALYWTVGTFSGTDDRSAFEVALTAGLPLRLSAGKRYRWREHPNNAAVPATGFITLTTRPDIELVGADGAWIFLDEDCETRIPAGNGIASYGIDTRVQSPVEIGQYGECKFINLNVRSRWRHYPGTNLDGGVNGTGHNWCRIEGYKLFQVIGGQYEDFRQKLSRNRHNARVEIRGTRGFRLSKGMWREVNSNNVTCTENYVDGAGDDCLDFTYQNADGTNPAQFVGTSCVISQNIVRQGQNIVCAGYSHAIISENILDLMVQNAITATFSLVTDERPRVSLSIRGNKVINPLMPYVVATGDLGTATFNTASILIRGGARTAVGTVFPGDYNPGTLSFLAASALSVDGSYLATKTPATVSSAGGHAIDISNNEIARTMPSGVSFSAWEQGWMFSPVGFVNPTVTDAGRLITGFCAGNDINGLRISGNTTLRIEYPIRLLETTSNDVDRAFRNVLIDGNICIDCIKGFGHSRSGGPTKYNWDIIITNNVFDVDPEHRSPYRTTPIDGSWVPGVSVLDAPCGIDAKNLPRLAHGGNIFKNCYNPITSDNVGTPARTNPQISMNIVQCEPVATVYDAGNKGVAVPGNGAEFVHVVVDSNPTSGTFRQLITVPVSAHSGVPTTGTYVTGHYIRNTVPTTSGGKTRIGWVRQSVGSGHVVATTTTADWAPIFTTTS